MYFIYILQSTVTKRYYTGSTENLERRIQEHNANKTKSIKNSGPFILVYSETFQTRAEAVQREREIKSYKGGNAFRKLLSEKTK